MIINIEPDEIKFKINVYGKDIKAVMMLKTMKQSSNLTDVVNDIEQSNEINTKNTSIYLYDQTNNLIFENMYPKITLDDYFKSTNIDNKNTLTMFIRKITEDNSNVYHKLSQDINFQLEILGIENEAVIKIK